jgi:hypothetical protein
MRRLILATPVNRETYSLTGKIDFSAGYKSNQPPEQLYSMKQTLLRRFTQLWLLTAGIALMVCGAKAVDFNLLGTNMPTLDFHGFLSQGFLATTKYNYLGNDTKDGSFKFTEAGLNVSMNPFPRTRISAQGFLYDVGEAGKYQPFLDYASIEYTFNDYIGLRGGRIRRPQGIYNDIQDVDLARTYVLLPQGIYDSRYRDFSASVDGGEVFGDIPLGNAGALSYETYAGYVSIGVDSGVAEEINNALPGGKVTSFNPFLGAGSQLWWNTPVDGLRFGASFTHGFDFDYNFTVPTGYPPPYPSSASLRAVSQLILQEYSAEYLWNRWTFQAEFYHVQESQGTTSPAGTINSFFSAYAWYGATAYRFNKWLEVGGYYTEYHANEQITMASDGSQKDAALSFRFDPLPWWLFKIEGHYIRGTALLDDNADNPVRSDRGWFMLLLKTTVSF